MSLMSNESDVQNNFVDSNKGSISGNVSSADGISLPNVNITLLDNSSVVVATTATDSDGKYMFAKVLPGDFVVVETNPWFLRFANSRIVTP